MNIRYLLISFLIPSIFAMEDKQSLNIETVKTVIKSIPSPIAVSIAENSFSGFKEEHVYVLDHYLEKLIKINQTNSTFNKLSKEDFLANIVIQFLHESNALEPIFHKEDVPSIKIEFVSKMLRFIILSEFITISNGDSSTTWGGDGNIFYSKRSIRECQYYDENCYDVNLYKIHLMPRDCDYEKFWTQLLKDLHQHKDILSKLLMIKAKVIPESYGQYLGTPKIVLYIPGGKNDAQYVLNKIYELYHAEVGCGYGPNFNEKVTDFIWFAQGNRDQKNKELDDNYSEEECHFEFPDRIYFKADFDGKTFGNTPQDYKLKNPERHFKHHIDSIKCDVNKGASRKRSPSF